MPNITAMDVAKRAGVSQTTVSFVINNNPGIIISPETKERVMHAAAELGYTPRAKSGNYQKPSDNLLALIVPNISNTFYPELARNIEKYALSKGYKLFITNTNRDAQSEKYCLELLRSIKAAGIIYGFTPTSIRLFRAMQKRTPIVVIGETPEALDVDTISLSSYEAGQVVARHLYELGHHKIAFITSPHDAISLSRKRRMEGLQDFWMEKGLGGVVVCSDDSEMEFTCVSYEFEIGCSLALQALEHNVTAIIGANDMIAYGVMKALAKSGISVPEQISVCGFDNIFVPNPYPPYLTTVDHCTEHRCKLAVDLLEDRIKGKAQAHMRINYTPYLVQKDSTGPAK